MISLKYSHIHLQQSLCEYHQKCDTDSGSSSCLTLFCFLSSRRRDEVIYLTSCSQSVWLLYSDRRTIYYSTDVSNPDSIRLGIKWRQIDMAQLGQLSQYTTHTYIHITFQYCNNRYIDRCKIS